MRNLILYIACIVYTAYVTVMHNSNSVAILLFTELFIPIPLFVLALYQGFKLKFFLHFPLSVIEKEQEGIIEIKINNPTPFPIPRLRITLLYENRIWGVKKKRYFKTAVGKQVTETVPLSLMSDTCGVLDLTIKRIRIYDYLGLFFWEKKVEISRELTILPKVHETSVIISGATRNFTFESDIYDKTKGGNDPSEVFQIRDYRIGDRPQSIHWKLTAKSNELMVKEFSRPIGCAVVFLLSAKKINDSFIEAFTSLSNEMIGGDCRHYVVWYDRKTCDLERHMIETLEQLYEVVTLLYQNHIAKPEDSLHMLYRDKYPGETFSTELFLDEHLVLYKNQMEMVRFVKKDLAKNLQDLIIEV